MPFSTSTGSVKESPLIQVENMERLSRLKQRLQKQLSRFSLTEEREWQLVKELDAYAKLVIDVHLSHKTKPQFTKVKENE